MGTDHWWVQFLGKHQSKLVRGGTSEYEQNAAKILITINYVNNDMMVAIVVYFFVFVCKKQANSRWFVHCMSFFYLYYCKHCLHKQKCKFWNEERLVISRGKVVIKQKEITFFYNRTPEFFAFFKHLLDTCIKKTL